MVPTKGRNPHSPLTEMEPFRLAALQTITKYDARASGAPETWVNVSPNDFLHHHKASRECLVHTAEATFAFKTITKVPVPNSTSSPQLL